MVTADLASSELDSHDKNLGTWLQGVIHREDEAAYVRYAQVANTAPIFADESRRRDGILQLEKKEWKSIVSNDVIPH